MLFQKEYSLKKVIFSFVTSVQEHFKGKILALSLNGLGVYFS